MRDILKKRWLEVGERTVGLAEEQPAERYDFRPTPEIWTFAEQLRHVAYWHEYVRDTLRGTVPAGDANFLPAESHATKEQIVAALRASVDQVAAELSATGAGGDEAGMLDTMVGFIEHGGEHYGQLAVYLRLNGIVPPASR